MRETASARRQALRHVASILDSARKLGIRDAHEKCGPRRLSVSNSLSGRHWELDQVPAVGDPTDIVQFGTGRPCVRQRRSTACGPSTTRGCVPRWRRPDVRRHATLPQSWMQRENWEFEMHRCTSRSRRPGTCGRRSVPSLSSTHFGITWSIRWRPFGCARPDRWAETSEPSPTRSRSRSGFARESSPSVSSSPPTTCSCGGPGGNTIAFAASAHDSRPCWCISSTASFRNWSASGTRSRLRDASRC